MTVTKEMQARIYELAADAEDKRYKKDQNVVRQRQNNIRFSIWLMNECLENGADMDFVERYMACEAKCAACHHKDCVFYGNGENCEVYKERKALCIGKYFARKALGTQA